MAKYRKKPVVIEACRVGDSFDGAPLWALLACREGTIRCAPNGGAFIKTLEGEMLANDGDWIIRGVEGELYPLKPSIFRATYEEMKEPTSMSVG